MAFIDEQAARCGYCAGGNGARAGNAEFAGQSCALSRLLELDPAHLGGPKSCLGCRGSAAIFERAWHRLTRSRRARGTSSIDALGRGPRIVRRCRSSMFTMHALSHHKLPLLRPQGSVQAGQHLSQFLGITRVTALGDVRHPACVGGAHIGAFSVAIVALGVAAAVEVVPPGDFAAMMLCLQGSGEMRVHGRVRPVRANHGILIRPDGPISAEFSEDCVRLVVRIDAKLIDSPLAANGTCFELSNPGLRPWLEYLQFVLSSQAIIDAIATDDVVRARVEDLMTTLLQRTCLPALAEQPMDLAVTRDVRRAEAYVRSHLADDVSLSDIANAVGVSERTLQSNFRRSHGVSPMQFLRNLRLDTARERILSGLSVAQAAFDSGFWHQGRFAKYYRERFGDLPSSDMQRPFLVS